MMMLRVYKVSQITCYIKDLLETDLLLQDLWLEGEVSNLSRSTAGHVYFTLKDEESQIACVLWRSQAEQQISLPRNGDAVICHGHVSVYEVQGRYQFYVGLIQPAGLGALHLEFEALKARLQAEGLFDVAHKRPLPPFPRRLGVVTSPVGAALRDILHVLERRYPLAEVVLAPTLVQGEEAPEQIAEAIRALNEETDVEAIIVGRGGGSLEELWAFNDERVARAIFASRVPVVCGVGHETDVTIADFVADLRAPTPSAAAELAVPDRRELQATVRLRERRLARLMRGRLEGWGVRLEGLERALSRLSPQARVESDRQQVDELARAALAHLRHDLDLRRERLRGHISQLQSLSPLTTLARGYSITTHLRTGQIVKRVAQVSPGDPIEVQVRDGTFGGIVGRQRSLGI
jgi:exodeoxyribonuclease VII large subunit